MPWRLIIIIVVFAIFLVFISFNLGDENKCDIGFGFVKIPQVPVFITIFASFILGFFSALPLILFIKSRKKEKPEKEKKEKKPKKDDIPDGGGNAA